MNPPVRFETERLLLRALEMTDAEAIFYGYAQDSVVAKYQSWVPHDELETVRKFVAANRKGWEEDRTFSYSIYSQKNQEFLGQIEMRPLENRVELGYCLCRAYWGQGIMPEAAAVLQNWALAQPEIYRVWAVCDIDNHASARVLEKIGMQREGLLKSWTVHPNLSLEPRDCWSYSKVKN